eukprot:m.156696 g.156696  ORF g.156696 m.156696 type:complete len:536 (+) comp31017_c1_seq1:357-1964(+)
MFTFAKNRVSVACRAMVLALVGLVALPSTHSVEPDPISHDVHSMAINLVASSFAASSITLRWTSTPTFAKLQDQSVQWVVWRQYAIQSRINEWLVIGETSINTTVWESVGLVGNTQYKHAICLGNTSHPLSVPSSSLSPLSPLMCSPIVSQKTLDWNISHTSRVIQRGSATYPRIGEATMVRLGNELLLFTSRQSSAADVGASNITLQRSSDDGLSWSAPVVIEPSPSHPTAPSRANPGAAVVMNGTLVLTYFVGVNHSLARRVYRHSHDGGLTWTAEQELSDGSYDYMTGAHDRLRVLSNGRLVQALHFKIATGVSHLATVVFSSDDGGYTWVRRGLVNGDALFVPAIVNKTDPYSGVEACNEFGFYETALAETSPTHSPGDLLMVGRTCTGWLYQSSSLDYGTTWSVPTRSPLRHPLAPPNIEHIAATAPDSNDTLVIITSPHYTGSGSMLGSRFVLAIQTSHGRGKTWVDYHELEGNGTFWFSYCSVFADAVSQRLHLTYRVNDKLGAGVISIGYQSIALEMFRTSSFSSFS